MATGLIEKIFGRSVSAVDLHQRMARGEPMMLIDVRTPKEFSGPEGRIPGARSIPLERLKAEAGRELGEFDGEIILVCRRGLRSRLALIRLRRLGLEATNLAGGMIGWRREGFETIAGCPGPGVAPVRKPC